MSGDGLAALSGLTWWRRERQPLHQVETPAGKPGREPGDTGDELGGGSQDALRPALPYRADDLAGGPLGIHRDEWQAGAEREPGELLVSLPGEAGLQVRAGADQPGHDGGDGHRAAAQFGAQAFGEAD